MLRHASYVVALVGLAAGCQLRLDGAGCPCAVGWTCCPTVDRCERGPDRCPGSDEPDAGSQDASGAAARVTPVAPTPGHWMYQGSQTAFRRGDGTTCTGRVAASMGERSFCYLAANNDVRCAGRIGDLDHSSGFRSVGQRGATQILVMSLYDGMCVANTDHTVRCIGTNSNAFGDTVTPAAFTQWSAHTDVAAIASGTWDQLCGITGDGQVFCAGFPGYGVTPVDVGPPGQTSVWVDTMGAARLSDAGLLRTSESRTVCQIKPHAMVCDGASYGPTNGTIVMGSEVDGGSFRDGVCWLTEAAAVTCTYGPRFADGEVVYLAANLYTDSLCAIYRDGSVWCIGSNTDGKLGTGTTSELEIETMVAPPGSARFGCDS